MNSYKGGWQEVTQGSGNVVLKAPTKEGSYEVRFYDGSSANDLNLALRLTIPFTVSVIQSTTIPITDGNNQLELPPDETVAFNPTLTPVPTSEPVPTIAPETLISALPTSVPGPFIEPNPTIVPEDTSIPNPSAGPSAYYMVTESDRLFYLYKVEEGSSIYIKKIPVDTWKIADKYEVEQASLSLTGDGGCRLDVSYASGKNPSWDNPSVIVSCIYDGMKYFGMWNEEDWKLTSFHEKADIRGVSGDMSSGTLTHDKASVSFSEKGDQQYR